MGFSVSAKVQYTPRADTGRFIEAKVTPGIVKSVAAAQGLMVQEAKAIVPVRTGQLRDSIHAEPPDDSGNTVIGAVVADAHHAGFIEFGTGIRGAASPMAGKGITYSATWPGMEPKPYLRPAMDSTREVVKSVFASQIAVALKS